MDRERPYVPVHSFLSGASALASLLIVFFLGVMINIIMEHTRAIGALSTRVYALEIQAGQCSDDGG